MSDFEIVCPSCGSTEFTVSKKDDVFEYGCAADAIELRVLVPVNECDSCGFAFTGEDAEDLRHEAVCRHLGRMTPKEIRELRKAHGLTRAELAAFTGIGIASLARWETGQLVQGAAHDSLLYLLLSKSNLESLAARTPDSNPKVPDQNPETILADGTFVHITANDSEVVQLAGQFSLHLN